MALLNFPPSPTNGELYPVVPFPGQNQYRWEADTSTWRLVDCCESLSAVYTAKGQIQIGTGAGTSATLDVGDDTAALVADSSSPTGLSYTNNVKTAILIPVGETLERPATPRVGQLRYNTTTGVFEGYGGSPSDWISFDGMPTGANGDKIFYLNSQVVTADYTLPSTPLAKNAVSAGPITINTGVTVTIPSGQGWSVV